MSLLPLIRFRNLDAQLTDDEFFNQFIKSVGRELIIKSLFNHYKNNLNEISTITNIQSDIINKREENQQEILSYDCIDQLPSELISECASYLNYKQYFKLAKCNRKIYIACYTFPKIYCMLYITNLRDVSKDLNAFKNIETLFIRIKDFNALSASNKSTWCKNNSLQTLRLSNYNCNENDTISFINNQHLINYNNVKTLQLYLFTSVLIFDILSKFTQTQKLGLYGIQLDNNVNLPDKNKIKKWFPNVKSLELSGTNTIFAGIIIEVLHNQLESLSVDDSNATIPSNITFPKLQSLKLSYPTNVDFLILKMSPTLKSVTIKSNKEDIINTFIDNAICKQLSLENVKIESTNVNSFSILQKLQSTLEKNGIIKRKCKRLCIELIFEGRDPYNDDKMEFGLQIFRIINVLKVLNIDNWCLKIEHKSHNFAKEYLENELNEMKRNYFINYQMNQHDLTIVISNTK